MSRATNEAPVLRGALEFLASRRDQAVCWRNNNTAVYDRAKNQWRAFNATGVLKGVSDILGILTWNGRLLAFEAKKPAIPAVGQKAGTLSADQLAFLVMVNESGGVGVCFDDLRTLIDVMDRLSVDPSARFNILGIPEV